MRYKIVPACFRCAPPRPLLLQQWPAAAHGQRTAQSFTASVTATHHRRSPPWCPPAPSIRNTPCRKAFPDSLKSHRSHDIVLLCITCHQTAHQVGSRGDGCQQPCTPTPPPAKPRTPNRLTMSAHSPDPSHTLLTPTFPGLQAAERLKRRIADEYGVPLLPPRPGAPQPAPAAAAGGSTGGVTTAASGSGDAAAAAAAAAEPAGSGAPCAEAVGESPACGLVSAGEDAASAAGGLVAESAAAQARPASDGGVEEGQAQASPSGPAGGASDGSGAEFVHPFHARAGGWACWAGAVMSWPARCPPPYRACRLSLLTPPLPSQPACQTFAGSKQPRPALKAPPADPPPLPCSRHCAAPLWGGHTRAPAPPAGGADQRLPGQAPRGGGAGAEAGRHRSCADGR